MYDGTVCVVFLNVPKSWLFCRMLELLNIEKLNFKHISTLTAYFYSFSHAYAKHERSCQHVSHDLNSEYTHVTSQVIQTAVIRFSHALI